MDPLGYGASRPPEREFLVEPDHFFKMDALDGYALMQALSFEKFSIFGWCNGGVSAIILAALHPESVQKLVIWGTNAYITTYDVEVREKIRDVSGWNQRIREEMQSIYGDSLQSLWSRYVDAMKDIYEKRKDGDLCMEEVKRVQCPTLIVHGAKDTARLQFYADYLKNNIRESEMVIMEEGKHSLHLKYAQEFNQLTERFLLK
jgi:valacyclovir hydrolase